MQCDNNDNIAKGLNFVVAVGGAVVRHMNSKAIFN